MNNIIIFLLILTSCGEPEYSPWQSNISYKDLTIKHLSWLSQSDGQFEPFKIAVSGDPQAVVGHLRNIIDVVNIQPVDFVTILGDLTDLGFRREWIWIGESLKRSNKPVLTVVGNHDGLNEGDKIYKQMFGPLNYSFIYKDVKFIMWNNNLYEWGAPNFDWLEAEVLSHPRVVVMSHQPPYSETLSHSDEKRWKQIRNYPSYQVSLHGHVHNASYQYEKQTDTIIYTVDRVTGTHFGILSILEHGYVLEDCIPSCSISGGTQ